MGEGEPDVVSLVIVSGKKAHAALICRPVSSTRCTNNCFGIN